MKNLLKCGSFVRGLAAGLLAMTCVTAANAHPYAGAVTNIGGGVIQFVMNEAGATVNVVFGDGTTNAMGVLPKGQTNFTLPGTNTTYSIYCTKLGNGTPALTSTDGATFNTWGNTLRGVGVNKNPKTGYLFGRTYVSVTGTTASRQWGVYALTPDLQSNAFFGGANTNALAVPVTTFTVTITNNPVNGNTYTLDSGVVTWTNSVTNPTNQVSTAGSAAAAAANMYSQITNNHSLPAGLTVSISNNVITLTQISMNITTAGGWASAVQSESGPFGPAFITGNNGLISGPTKLNVNDDGTVTVSDSELAGATTWLFTPNFDTATMLLGPQGHDAGLAQGSHGYVENSIATGSIAAGNLVLYTVDPSLGAPASATLANGGIGNFGQPQATTAGDFNEIYRYTIGAGPLPWTNPPDMAVTLCLNGGFQDSQVLDLDLGPNTNYIYGQARRANFSDGCVQVFYRSNFFRIYTSLHGTPSAPTDIFQNCYAGVRISPDGRYLAGMTVNNAILVCALTNGVPDESSLVTIANTPTTANGRELCWDAADNLIDVSSGQGLLRSYSLGISTTCVTANDITGTNGSFSLTLPPVVATVAKLQDGSQNYINNAPPGTPIAGQFQITLGTNNLAAPVAVAITLGGTAANGVNYTLNTGTDANGVLIAANLVTFPAGAMPGGGNWTATLNLTPTATPLSGPTLTATLRLAGGANYIAGTPISASLNILNTGPQFLFLGAAGSGSTMYRGIAGDYARFTITRWGDLNGPSNSAGSVSPKAITVNTFTYGGTAAFPADYTARSQRTDPAGNGVVQAPTDGSPGIVINPGDVTVTAVVGNPVLHANTALTPTNVTIVISLTNSVTGTNGTSVEGYGYTDNAVTATLTEIDNTVGQEVVLWSDPLTNSAINTYALTFASTNLGPNTVLPVYIPNYAYTLGGPGNGNASGFPGNSNNFEVELGWPVGNEPGLSGITVPPSPVMAANSWSNVMRMTVNKAGVGSACAVNVFPTSKVFTGNYALRFSMYLDVWQGAINNTVPLTFDKEFALFGINSKGTNCNWRPAINPTAGTGSSMTNADGVWFAIDSGDGTLTPADFDAFTSPNLPNGGVTADLVSNNGLTQNGIFKRPPFPVTTTANVGSPINHWVDVSVELSAQTNVNLYMNRSSVLANFSTLSGGPAGLGFTNGVPMLGYLDPFGDQSDESAFVYYSNVRVVELSPYISVQPISYITNAGANLSLTTAAVFGTAPLTNQWYVGSPGTGVLLQTDTANATNINSTLILTNLTAGTNYFCVVSDVAGSVTSLVASVEFIYGPTNATVTAGQNFTFRVTPNGPAAPSTNFWSTNAVRLANGNKYAGVTTTALTITNCQPADALTYTIRMTNATGPYQASATLTVLAPPSNVVVAPAAQTNIWGSTANFTVSASGTAPFTYQWKKGGVNLSDGGNIAGSSSSSLTISSVTQADAASYTAGVTNAAGGAVSSAGVLSVFTPPPTMGAVVVGGGNATLSFSSTNAFDTTNAFILQSSPLLNGTFTNTPGTFTTSGGGSFQVVTPETGGTMFYRLLHVP